MNTAKAKGVVHNNGLIGSYTPYRMAMRDISKYLKSQNLKIFDGEDVWVATPNTMLMFRKDMALMNRELGLHIINKCGERMARRKSENKSFKTCKKCKSSLPAIKIKCFQN